MRYGSDWLGSPKPSGIPLHIDKKFLLNPVRVLCNTEPSAGLCRFQDSNAMGIESDPIDFPNDFDAMLLGHPGKFDCIHWNSYTSDDSAGCSHKAFSIFVKSILKPGITFTF